MNETDNNRIRESIEQIEPADGAKERMLANIRRKAAEQSSENAAAKAAIVTGDFSDTTASDSSRKASPSRRITKILRLAVPAAACLLIVILGAVHFFPRESKPSGAGNTTVTATATVTQGGISTYGPLTTYASAEELADATGIRIDAPAGATDVTYESAGRDFAQILFVYDGREYTYRAAASDDDFSGLYGEESQPRQLVDADGAVLTIVQDEIADSFKLVWKNAVLKNILIGPADTPDEKIVEVYRKLAAK